MSVFPATKVEKGKQPLFTLNAANQTPISAFGERSFTLDIGLRRVYRWVFILADVASPLLGADFLAHFSLAVDVKHRKLMDLETSLSVNVAISTDTSPSPS